EVVEPVLGGDRRGPDAALGEGEVLGDPRVQVVADHEHVEVLVNGVDGVGPCGVGGRRKDVGGRGHGDDVGGVAPARPLGVVGVDRPALDGGQGVGDEAGLVQGVGVHGDLDAAAVGCPEAGV